MTLRTMTKKASVATLLTGALLAGSIATAAWLANGSGTGAATAITATALTVDPDTAGSGLDADLYPGQANGDLFITINNPNPYPVTVTEITPGTGSVTSDVAACDTNGNAVSLDATTTVSIDVLANDSTTVEVPNIVNMGITSADECQGAVFDIPVDVTGENDQTP